MQEQQTEIFHVYKKSFPSVYDLYRGLPEIHIKDNIQGKISSAAFTNDRMSVDRSDMCTIKETVSRKNTWVGVGVISHRIPPILNQRVEHDPKSDNPAHTLVIGKKGRRVCREFAKAAKLVMLRKKKK